MVRAAAAGIFNYANADPTEKNWRIRHRLLLNEIYRREEQQLLLAAHQHWCAYVAHGNLTEDSFSNIKQELTKTFTALHSITFPWQAATEPQVENSTIDAETQKLIDVYRQMVASNQPQEQDDGRTEPA